MQCSLQQKHGIPTHTLRFHQSDILATKNNDNNYQFNNEIIITHKHLYCHCKFTGSNRARL